MVNVTFIFILIWKNFKIDIQHPWRTALVIFTPIVCITILIIFRVFGAKDVKEIETVFDSYDINRLPAEEFNSSNTYVLYYAPKSVFIDKIMREVASYLNVSSVGFETEDQLEFSYITSEKEVVAGVVFNSNLKNGPSRSGPIKYTIRPPKILGIPWNLSSIAPRIPIIDIIDKTTYGTHYMSYGFLSVQHVVAKTLMDNFFSASDKKFDDMFVIEMRRQPYPHYEVDTFYKTPDYYIALAICVGFLFPSILIAKSIVHEKQTHMKQILRLMGIPNWENWTARFIKEFLLLAFCSLIISALLCIRFSDYAVFNKSDASLILLWLVLYSSSVIAFTFFIASLFDDEHSAASAICILHILTFLPYIHSKSLFTEITQFGEWISCLLPNTLFSYSIRTVLGLELFGSGLQWKTLEIEHEVHGKFNMAFVFVALLLDTFIYFILTWYIEVMRPTRFQDHHPWYFPFTATYWTGNKEIPPYASLYDFHYKKPDFIEKDPSRVKPMIDIKNLTKVYGKYSKPVVNHIDLRAYKGQITVLLGANSSGKSTFASMIYGAIPPTAGTILLKGQNLWNSADARRITPLLGICPDFNISIDELSIEDNMYFFCRVKGYDSGLEAEISHILASLDLEIKKRRRVSSLGPHLKRRLSVGIALAGDSEIVILDEPTLCMDSYSRRITWDALLFQKDTRAIFVTTSHMKEAIALGDRIAVLQNGQIKCCGSPLFLKAKYGAGYLLIITKDSECSSIILKNLIFSKIPNAVVTEDTESELKVMLPYDSCKSYKFLFKDLEDRTDLKIKGVFITETTLDELFEKISGHSFKGTSTALKSFKSKDSVYRYFKRKRNEGFALFYQHMFAILRKRHMFSKHKLLWTAALVLLLPVLMALASLQREIRIAGVQDFHNESIFNLKEFEGTNVVYGIDPSSNLSIILGDTYGSLLDSEKLEIVDLEEQNYLTYLIEKAEKDLLSYKSKYIIGAVFTERFNRNVITAFYNSDAYHSAPTSLLYAHNTLLKYYTKESSFYFEVNNHPLPYRDIEEEVWSSDFNLSASFLWAQDLMTGLSIFMSSYIVLLVVERARNSKKQQFINGLNAFVYWFANLLYDFSLYIVSCLCTIFVLVSLEAECLSVEEDISALAVLLLLHGLSALLFIYCCTFSIKSSAVAYMCIFLYYFLGLFLLFIIYRLEDRNWYHVSEPLNAIFTAFMPSYCVARGIYNIHRNCKTNYICNNEMTQIRCLYRNFSRVACCLEHCEDSCMFWSADHYSLSIPGIGKQLIALILQPFLFCAILILLEMEIFQNLELRMETRRYFSDEFLPTSNTNVNREADKMLTSPLPKLVDEDHYLILRQVSKYSERFIIGKYSFGVKKGECFGLVGVESAGKSTLLKMMGGIVPLSTGNIYIDGFSILKYPNKIQDKIGFSFGTSALVKHFTVEETLKLYARIRGIPEHDIPYCIDTLTNILSLNCFMKIKKCNITTRKKICVAIAIIGTPPLILLDEPTDDMDPESSMSTIEALKHALDVGCTIVLASHKIDDCLTICNRIGIVVKGKMTYIGDCDYLKSQYADGFTLILRIQKSRQSRFSVTRQAITLKGNLEEIKGLIEDALPQAVLKTEYTSFLNYYVPEQTIIWSKLFNLLENMKSQELIFNYSICETTLEHIFSYHVVHSKNLTDTKISDFLKARKRRRT